MKTSEYGLIFDIKRFAVHDGAGLRTTVFFKGCPLRCKWCQNPEGLSNIRRPLYFEKSCIHCKLCQQNALLNQIKYEGRPYFNLNYQGVFDNLIKICPAEAIRYDSEYYSVDMLIDRIKQDKVFYRNGGGVTLSGGEPFNQGPFLIALLKRLKQEKIEAAIETSFYTSRELIEQTLPYLERIYIDLKIFDDECHELYTGVKSALIKENIANILTSKYKNKVIIRTPLIKEITATDSNIKAIAGFISGLYPEVKYELLNYNPLAPTKYELVDLKYELDKHHKMLTSVEMRYFYELAYQAGIKNMIIE